MPTKTQCNQSNNKPMKFLGKSDFYKLYELLKANSEIDIRLKTLVILLQFSGLRIGEALGLKWTDIDFHRNTISVERRIKREEVEEKNFKTQLIVAAPKTANSTRVVPLPDKVLNALKELKKHQNEEKDNSYGLYENREYVFATPIGTPVDSRNELRRFKRFLNQENFRTDISFHTLRHSYLIIIRKWN